MMLLHTDTFLSYSLLLTTLQAFKTVRHVYPSEYAYHDDSFNKTEGSSANCTRYPDNLQPQLSTDDYIHCTGSQLKLADSDLGPQQYNSSASYVWNTASLKPQLLFIFPTRVTFTSIILHYYRDGDRGLPGLKFYDVRDDFNIWNAPVSSSKSVTIHQMRGGEPAGRMNVSINVNFNTKKVLMFVILSRYFQFAFTEVEFFTSESEGTTISTSTMIDSPTSRVHTEFKTTFATNLTTIQTSSIFMRATSSAMIDVKPSTVKMEKNITIGVSIAILLILSTILIVIVVVLILNYKRRSAKRNLYTDSSYSTPSRGSGQQIQSHSVQQDSAGLYDQVHLSPSTGQTEFISKPESENINNPIYSTAGDDRAEHSSALNIMYQAIPTQLPSQKARESTSELPTYAAVDKNKKKFKKQTKKEDQNCTAAEKGPPVSPYTNDSEVSSAPVLEKKETTEKQNDPSHTIEELYTAVKKRPKDSEPKDEEEMPSIPPHTVEELYTAVEKKPKSNLDENKEAPSITVLQNIAEDLYTAVMKKPKDGSADGTEAAPPLPPHTVEELYTAVVKRPKESAEKEETAPPIPPI